jgi:hypothetical protein
MEPRKSSSSSEKYPAISLLQLINSLSGWLLLAGAAILLLGLQVPYAIVAFVGSIACFATNALLQIAIDCEAHLRGIDHKLYEQNKRPKQGAE